MSEPISKFRRGRKGFMLVQTMMAVFVTATAAAVVAVSSRQSVQNTSFATISKAANAAAVTYADQVTVLGYAATVPQNLLNAGLIDSITPVSTNTYSANNITIFNGHTIGQLVPSGTAKLEITSVSNNVQQLRMIITFTEQGRTYTEEVSTRYANL